MLKLLKSLLPTKRQYRYRSAITGKWVKEAFAKANPETTVKVRIA